MTIKSTAHMQTNQLVKSPALSKLKKKMTKGKKTNKTLGQLKE